MDGRDRRLSVRKTSSSKIGKPSSAPRAPSTASSRPPDTVVSAHLTNFRHVVQQLTGTPPPSASSSPLHDSSRSSRLQRIAPPRLRSLLHHPKPQHPHQSAHHHHQQQMPVLPPLQQPHQHYMPHDIYTQDHDQPQHPDFSWLSSVELFSPRLPSTQVSNLNQNPGSNVHGFINPNPSPPLLSPRLFSALTPGESMWANRFTHATPSPRILSNSAGLLPTLLPLPSVGGEDLETGCGKGHRKTLEQSVLSIPSPKSSPRLPPLLNEHPLFPSPHSMHLPSQNRHPSSSSFSIEQSAHSPWMLGHPLLPSPPPTLHPLSPSPACYNHWLPPWSPSPFLPIPLPFSPGLRLPSPGLGPFNSSSPGGFFLCGTNYDHQSKLP